MPHRELGLWGAWRQLALLDTHLSKDIRHILKDILDSLPENSYDAVSFLLSRIGISQNNVTPYIQWHLGRLPGWVGYMRWHIEQMEKTTSSLKPQGMLLADYLVLRLCHELAFCEAATQKHFGCSARIDSLQQYFSSRAAEYFV